MLSWNVMRHDSHQPEADPPPAETGNAALMAAWAVAMVAVVAGMAAMMVLMMGGNWGPGGHMGWRTGSSGADQTPVVSTAAEVTVDMRDSTFVPAKLTVNAGTTVTWVNSDSLPHTATAKSKEWSTGNLNKGDSD